MNYLSVQPIDGCRELNIIKGWQFRGLMVCRQTNIQNNITWTLRHEISNSAHFMLMVKSIYIKIILAFENTTI